MLTKEQIDKNSSDFHNELAKLIENYSAEELGLDTFEIMDGLISQFKIEACLKFECYYHALGFCTEMLQGAFEEMFEDINNAKDTQENASS